MSSTWNPEQYLRFAEQRRQPYEDLVARVQPRPGMRVVDLGCGPGELTVDLAERLDASSVVGIDHSEAMLARARSRATERVRFVHADIATHPLPEGVDEARGRLPHRASLRDPGQGGVHDGARQVRRGARKHPEGAHREV